MASNLQITSGENALIQFGLYELPGGDTWKGDWDIGTTYVTGDAVSFLDAAYECISDPPSNEDPTNVTYWSILSTGIESDDIRSVLVELIDSKEKVRANWSYRTVGAPKTSGSLVVGTRYRITSYVASDDFANVGAASNASDVEFTATGTTPTTWSNLSILQVIEASDSIFIADGAIKVELLASTTAALSGTFETRIAVAVADTDYISSGAETQVLCLENAVVITPC
jgi:hypothetical protein